MAEKVLGLHGMPGTMDPQVYVNLADGALRDYENINLDGKAKFYYKRAYLNCVRANDFLTTLLQYMVETSSINAVSAFNTRASHTRYAGISFTYRFGNTSNARKPNDNGSAEEEKGRAH